MSRRLSRAARREFKRRTPPGASPGMIVVDPAAPAPEVSVMAYGQNKLVEETNPSLARIAELRKAHPVVWIHVAGLGDAKLIRELGDYFHLHPLALEDVVHVHQRPKLEPYAEQLFIVARMVTLSDVIRSEQMSLFLGEGYVLTFVEDPGDVFDPVRQRIRSASGKIHARPAAYLSYALLDAVIDAHFPVLEELGERLEVLEDMIVLQPEPTTIAKIHDIKREMRVMRREMWPLREVCGRLSREHLDGIDDDVRLFFRDCYDHTVQIIDLIETYRELGADLTDLFLSSQSNRLNEIMKVLTFIATLFMPLSFIVGIYGMNFNTELPGNMPELNIPYAYVGVWVVMIVVTLGMLWFFYRQGWIGRKARIGLK